MKIGKKDFVLGSRTFIAGILNLTPDSFSDGGSYATPEAAVKRALEMVSEGADIIDVGGESTRPGHVPVTAEEEIARVAPVIAAIAKATDIPLSIDTYKAETAEAVFRAGAVIVNDVYAFSRNQNIAAVTAKHGAVCILSHNEPVNSGDIAGDVVRALSERVTYAVAAGVARDKIIVDPGIGFNKNYAENLAVLRSLERLRECGCPVMLAVSRKSVIGAALGLPVTEREEATVALTALGVIKNCDFIRVHDVQKNLRSAKMLDAVLRG